MAVALALVSACDSDDDDDAPSVAEQPEETVGGEPGETSPPQGPTGESPSITSDAYREADCAELTDPVLIDSFGGEGSVECGVVTVPSDWDNPDEGTLSLAVYRVPSTSETPASDPVVYLEGGPGGAGVGIVPDFVNGNAVYLRERGDVVVIDQRGTGYSQPALYCPEVFEAEESEGDLLEAHRACHDRLVGEGIDFANFNSRFNALDVEAVRAALGYEAWNLYGLSYGTRLALTVMRDSPGNVRSVVLDSVFPIEINGLSESRYPIYWAIEQIAINCAADDDCSTEVGDIKAVIERGLERLDANPVGEFDAESYLQIIGENIAEEEFAGLALLVANGSDEELAEALAGDEEPEDELPPLTEVPPSYYPILADTAEGMYYAVVCAEEAGFRDMTAGPDIAGDFSETTQRLVDAAFNSDEDFALCDTVYTVPAVDSVEAEAVNSDIPTLVLAGTADLATPPPWSLQTSEALPNSQYVEFAGLTHGLIGNNECLNDITGAFLDDPDTTIDQSCVAGLGGVDYVFE